MSKELEREIGNYYNGYDDVFENYVVWGIEGFEGHYNYLFEEKNAIDWDKPSLTSDIVEEEKVKLDVKEIQEKLQALQRKQELPHDTKLNQESLNLPHQYVKSQAYFSDRRAKLNQHPDSKEPAPLDLLKMQFFKDEEGSGSGPYRPETLAEKDFVEEQHQLMKAQQEGNNSMDYNIKDFPLAEPELINQLCEAHMVFFNLLSKLQETHTPTDFTTAFHIQDRIAYLIDNQTLLYKTLTKKLIKYLERINTKLKKYYDEITLKQEDLKKINAQISRFNEYDRKTQTRINQAAKETKWYKEDVQTYQEHIGDIGKTKELPGRPALPKKDIKD